MGVVKSRQHRHGISVFRRGDVPVALVKGLARRHEYDFRKSQGEIGFLGGNKMPEMYRVEGPSHDADFSLPQPFGIQRRHRCSSSWDVTSGM